MIALTALWAVLMAAWRFELGRCALLPRSALVALLGVLAIPGWYALGPVFWASLWGSLALYWTKGHNWESLSALLYRYGPPGVVYRLCFWLLGEGWHLNAYLDGPEAVARICIGAIVGATVGAMWLV